MEQIPLDLSDESACRQAHAAHVASRGYQRPWSHPEGVEEWITGVRHVDVDEDKELWVTCEDGRVVGYAVSWYPLADNTSMTWFDVLVHPDHRNRGHGTALLDRVVDGARRHERTTLVCDTVVPDRDPDHPFRRFLDRRGFTYSNTEIHRHLQLPVADELLDRLAAETNAAWADRYRLETHADGVPEPLLPSLCAVMGTLATDAPSGEIEFEEEQISPQRMLDQFALEQRQGRRRLTTVALDPDDQVVAYTELLLAAGDSPVVYQWGTLVHRAHRGHRLGMAVKLATLRRLQADFPQRERIITSNDDTNSFMVSVNEALGFEVVEYAPAYQRKL